MTMLILGVVSVLLILFFLFTYTVIDPNDAHVVVFMGRGRKIYSPVEKEGRKTKTSYFYIPLLMKRFKLPLTNVKMDIKNIHLNDREVAPFICDVITWLHISDPIQAAERLDLKQPFESLEADLINLVQAVARAVAMKQEVLDIMRDRQTFSKSVSAEVGDILNQWGVDLVNLEINDIRDDAEKDSSVISDYESIRKIHVKTQARQEVAIKNREAVEVEQDNLQKSEIAKAHAEEMYTKKQIEKDKNIGIAQQEQAAAIAMKKDEANTEEVKANRTLSVGNASVEKEAEIEKALGISEAVRIQGEKEADVIALKGNAEGEAIEAKGLAEAHAKDKMAEAMAKFNEAATGIEQLRAWIEVEKAKYNALGQALSSADLKLVQSGSGGNIFGFPLNAETGADLGQMLDGIGGLEGLSKLLPKTKNKEE